MQSICGYTPPFKLKGIKTNVYAAHFYSAWGVGIWSNKKSLTHVLNGVDARNKYMDEILFSWKMSMRLFKLRARSLNNLISMRLRGQWYGDCVNTIDMLLNNVYCIFPAISKIRNWGHDGSGLHCSVSDIYLKQEIDTDNHFVYDKIELKENKHVRKMLNRTDVNLWGRLIVFFRYIFFSMCKKRFICILF